MTHFPQMTQDTPLLLPSPKINSAHRDEFDKLIARLETDFASCSQALDEGEFRADGISDIARLYRSLQSAQGQSEDVEIWARFLEFTSDMWNAGHHQGALKLLVDARTTLSPPIIFLEHFEDSIAFARDEIIYLKAKRLFDEGEIDAARDAISGMSPDNKKSLEEAIGLQGNLRKTNRRRAFIAATVLIGVTFSASLYSLMSLPRSFDRVPAYSLPDIDLSVEIPGLNAPDQIDPKNIRPPKPQPPIVSPQGGDIFGDMPDARRPLEPQKEPSSPVQETRADKTTPPDVSEKILKDCALALRLSERAREAAVKAGTARFIDAAEALRKTHDDACAELDMTRETMLALTRDTTNETIDMMVRNLLIER